MIKILKKPKAITEIAVFSALLLLAIMLSTNKKYQTAVLDGIMLWAAAVLPALFPYLVITSIVSSLKITATISNALSPLTTKLFNVNGNVGYALFLSIMCGYPVGAKCVSELKTRKLIGDSESVRASALCSSSSPVFLMCSVGNLTFGNPLFGLLLFVTHFLSALTVGFIFSFYHRYEPPKKTTDFSNANKSENVLYDSVYSAVISVLVVGGIITLFYLLTEMLSDIGALKILSELFYLFTKNKCVSVGISSGIFECTKGIKILASCGISLFTLPITAAICGFGGISVIMQSVAYLKKAKIKTATFIFSKTLAAIINFILGLILSAIFLA